MENNETIESKIKSMIKRAEEVRKIVDEKHEPGRQDRCLRWVWKNFVFPEMGISLSTFNRYLKLVPTKKKQIFVDIDYSDFDKI